MEHLQRTPASARLFGWLVAGAMLTAIGYGMTTGDFADGLRSLTATPWGKVTVIDLYLGFAIFGAWIRVREGSTLRSLPWWIALAVGGNLTAGIYLIVASRRSESIAELLTGRA